MTLAEHVRCAIDDHEQRLLLSALGQACAGIDGTGERLFPNADARHRFVWTIDQYLWLIEPLLGLGINLEATTFSWGSPARRPTRFAEVLWDISRHHLPRSGTRARHVKVALHRSSDYLTTRFRQQPALPDTVIFALLAVVVFASPNSDQHLGEPYYLTHGVTQFVIDEWWGREADARAYVAQFDLPRIAMIL
jgi:hypothetical protein